jgi:hypothetical protein
MYGVNSSFQAWTTLASKYASQSKSWISHLKRQLQTLQQGSKTCTEFLNLAKQLVDQLSTTGKAIEDDDLISYVIGCLNPSFNTFVTVHSFATQNQEMSFADFQSELLNHEMLMENQQQQSAETRNFAFQANKTGQPSLLNQNSTAFRRPRYPPRPNSRFPPRNNTAYQPFAPRNNSAHQTFPHRNNAIFPPRHHTAPNQQLPLMNKDVAQPPANPGVNPSQANTRPVCQICGKNNHTALDCYHRMDYSFQGRHPPSELAAMVAHLNENFGAQKWLADFGANAHITADATNIHEPRPFEGADMVGVGNEAGLQIKNLGSSVVHSHFPNHPQLFLKDILHCPNAPANLLSINKFCIDNN